MAFNPFLGKSQEWLEQQLSDAQADYAAGKASTKVGAGDASSESRIEVSIIERIKQLYRALNALDPEQYPIDQITAIDRTRATFWGPADPNTDLNGQL